ncbi:MAG: universal stress protein [Truepera sp.]|nr:universal stress protein [Truepera sp.]
MTETILIPLDGSDFSRAVLPLVQHLFPAQTFDLLLLRVGPVPEGVTGRPPRPVVAENPQVLTFDSDREAEYARHPIYANQAWEAAKAELKAELEPSARKLRQAGYQVRLEVRFGEPAQEIADLVEEESVALVALATHGRSGLSRLVLGSVAEKVLRSLRVPVLMVRPAREGAAEPLPISTLADES